jgi:hypothetical protein
MDYGGQIMKLTFRTTLIAAAALLTGCSPTSAPPAAVGARVVVNGMQLYFNC